jgi:hypothetical protein
MGLLDGFGDFLKTPEGQGLLSATFGGLAGARRGAPLNSLGTAGLAGLQGYSGALDRNQQTEQFGQMQKSREMQMQVQQMQMDKARRDAEQEAKLTGLAQQFTTPAKPASSGGLPSNVSSLLPQEFQTGVQVNPMPAQAGGFDTNGYANALFSVDPTKAIAFRQSMAKDNTPVVLPEGGTLYSKDGTFLASGAPKTVKDDSKVTQFEYAKRNGYKGTFEQFVTLGPTIMAGAAAPLRAAQEANIYAENSYNLPQRRPAPAAKPSAPMRGQVVQGYRFKGGNPADQSNWEKQ